MTTWKEKRLDYHEFIYGKYAEEFVEYDDDRRLYVNTYKMIQEALMSLPQEPNFWVKTAINKQLDEDYKVLSAIIMNFKGDSV